MDEVTCTKTSPSLDEELPNADAPLWQYVNKLEKPLLLNQVETYILSATIVVECLWDPILGLRLIY